MADSMNPARSTFRDESQRLKDDVRGVGEHVGHVKDQLIGLGHDAASAAKTGVVAAKQELSDGIHAAKQKGDEALQTFSGQVTSKPLTSLGIALGVGVLIGMLVCRARS